MTASPKHTAGVIKSYLQLQKVLQHMVWPPQSSDLNIMESDNDCMKRQKTLRWKLLQDAWNTLYTKGGNTKYWCSCCFLCTALCLTHDIILRDTNFTFGAKDLSNTHLKATVTQQKQARIPEFKEAVLFIMVFIENVIKLIHQCVSEPTLVPFMWNSCHRLISGYSLGPISHYKPPIYSTLLPNDVKFQFYLSFSQYTPTPTHVGFLFLSLVRQSVK